MFHLPHFPYVCINDIMIDDDWRREFHHFRSPQVCDFLVPHGLGIQEVTCFIQRDEHGRLFLRPAAAMEASVASSTSDTEDEEEEWQPPMKGALVACIEARDEVLLDYPPWN